MMKKLSFITYRGLAIGLILILSLLPANIQAASTQLLFSPTAVSTQIGKAITVSVNVTSSQAINAASGTIVFPSNLLQASSVSTAGSVFSLWPQSPTISGQTISFNGGLPSPGYSGSGKIFSITFKALAAGTAGLSFTGAKVLANDGNGTDIFSGSNTAVITISTPPPTFVAATISSSSHPNQSTWYKTRDLTLSWTKPAKSDHFEYSLGTQSGYTKTTTMSFSDLTDGIWTFSLKTIYPDGQASSSYRAQIDTTAPDAFSVQVDQSSGSTDPKPTINYRAIDATSGIAGYTISLDGKQLTVTTDESFQLPNQLPGQHSVSVTANDKAGNSTVGSATFTIEGFQGPTITNWPRYLSLLEPLQLRGTALFDSRVQLYLAGEKIAEFNVKDHLAHKNIGSSAKVDQVVDWQYTYKGLIYPGPHGLYAYQVRPNEAVSNRSNEADFLVLPSSISITGRTIPILLVTVILLIVFLLIETLTWFHFKMVLLAIRRRLGSIRKVVDSDLDTLEKRLERSGARPNIELTKSAVDHELGNLSPEAKNKTKD